MIDIERRSEFTVPQAGEVHVWTSHVPDDAHLTPGHFAILNDEERTRADRIKVPHGRGRYISAHLLLRRALSPYLGLAPERIAFRRDLHGKPKVDLQAEPRAGVDPFFSLSHSHDSAAVAVSISADVGMDIEHVRPMAELAQMCERFFSPDERQFVHGVTGDTERHLRFFRIWARKEALLKALGTGISMSLSGFSVLGSNPQSDEAEVSVPLELFRHADEIVFIRDFNLRDGYAAAVASVQPIRRLLAIEPEGW
jgi:4'-phosphopantetheinyl transferase